MTPSDSNLLISPRDPTAGALGDFQKESRIAETCELERRRELRVWEVRAYIALPVRTERLTSPAQVPGFIARAESHKTAGFTRSG